MGKSIAEKIISEHLVAGNMTPGEDIAIRIDQTLTQDATGTMAYLQFEALGMKKVKTELSVSYVDHNMLQASFENADDHFYLQLVASKYGIYFSRPGNGICHQVHLERFGVPGKTLLGSDSHTPTNGGLGMIAIGAGGLDVAVAMGGGPFYMKMPEIINVRLTGKLRPFVSAKDIILEVLRTLTVKGGVGKIVEYGGPGVASLSVPERATITNMGAELGATTSVFPSDQKTKEYLTWQKRGKDFRKLEADSDAKYSRVIEINLSKLDALVAQPHSPDNVIEVRKLKNLKVNQVCVGSCTNSSLHDLTVVARLLKGKKIHPNVSMTVTPGSKQVFEAISASGALTDIIASGARIIESACGPCIGMGQAPGTDAVSVRSFNRNFIGRSGTKSANVYLASPETCGAAALTGELTDPSKLGKYPKIAMPKSIKIDDAGIIPPSKTPGTVKIIRGPNIAELPLNKPMPESVTGEVLLKVGDNITTDHIMPAGAKILPLRSNIPKISEFVYYVVDPDFPKRAREKGGGFIMGGENYGQGSSREHAALAPMYLGIKMVVVKSFARIHLANLINFGILPATFADPADHDRINQADALEIADMRGSVKGSDTIKVLNKTNGTTHTFNISLTPRQREIILAGGLLNYTKAGGK